MNLNVFADFNNVNII
ncbi:hypothetical protein [Borreliella garinii]|nr:hypothetical protein [Borreliella garinii]